MKMYLASKYSYRSVLTGLASILENEGHVVTSRWLQGNHTGDSDEQRKQYAMEDLADIDASDVVVVFELPTESQNPVSSAGRNIEFGYAYASGKQLIIVGAKHSIFHYLPIVDQYATVQDFLEAFTCT